MENDKIILMKLSKMIKEMNKIAFLHPNKRKMMSSKLKLTNF